MCWGKEGEIAPVASLITMYETPFVVRVVRRHVTWHVHYWKCFTITRDDLGLQLRDGKLVVLAVIKEKDCYCGMWSTSTKLRMLLT